VNSEDTRLNRFQTMDRKASRGIKPKSSSDSLGDSWWAKRWIQSFDYFTDEPRVIQGRNFAMKGQVTNILISPGKIEAKVQGNKFKPFSVRIEFNVFSDEEWQKVLNVLVTKAEFQAKMHIGKLPEKIEEIFNQQSLSLFPDLKNDLRAGCNCPDWAIPCKHVSAVYYLFANLFDKDPFLLFKLRGKTKNEVIQIINQKRTQRFISKDLHQNEMIKDSVISTTAIENFWTLKNSNITLPKEQLASLNTERILADAPFRISSINISQLICASYKKAKEIIDKELQKKNPLNE